MKKTNDKQFLNARAKAGAAARWKNHSPIESKVIRVSSKFIALKLLLANNNCFLDYEDVIEKLIFLFRYFENEYEQKRLSNRQGCAFLRIIQNIRSFDSSEYINAYKNNRFFR